MKDEMISEGENEKLYVDCELRLRRWKRYGRSRVSSSALWQDYQKLSWIVS